MLNSPNDRDKRLADLWPICGRSVADPAHAYPLRVTVTGPVQFPSLSLPSVGIWGLSVLSGFQPEAERGKVKSTSLLLEDAEPSFQSELSLPTVPASVKPH